MTLALCGKRLISEVSKDMLHRPDAAAAHVSETTR